MIYECRMRKPRLTKFSFGFVLITDSVLYKHNR